MEKLVAQTPGPALATEKNTVIPLYLLSLTLRSGRGSCVMITFM